MSDDTSINWKAKALALKAYALGHWDYAGPIAGLLVGYLLGKIL